MKQNTKRGMLIGALIAAAMAAGCAQDVGDIDRTDPNKIKKTDLTGVWFMTKTITDVPASYVTSMGELFEGSMFETDKVIFEIDENYLKVRRSYPLMPGKDDVQAGIEGPNSYEEIYGNGTYADGDLLGVYPIQSHFDVQRQYDAATGEQSNVIVENTSDRNWYEREYMRVDWSKNANISWEEIYMIGVHSEVAYDGTEDYGDPKNQPYFEYDPQNGDLLYFDTPTRLVVKIDPYAWIRSYRIHGWANVNDVAYEIRVSTAYARDLGDADPRNNYEPLPYNDHDMMRFGYFRAEHLTQDIASGTVYNSGRIQLANRYNIWQAAYNIDANGNRTAIPIEQRVVRTSPYYIRKQSTEPHLHDMQEQVIDEWNVAFKRAVYLMQNPNNTNIGGIDLVTTHDYETLKVALASQKDVFVPCHIPVAPNDNAVCGQTGYVPRDGDFRNNYLWVVPQDIDVGLLGCANLADDPLTGRTIGMQAHVYLMYMNSDAYDVVEHIKFAKGEYTPQDVIAGDAALARAADVRDKFQNMLINSDRLRATPLKSAKKVSDTKKKMANRDAKVRSLRTFNRTAAENSLQNLISSGRLATDLDDAILRSYANSSNKPLAKLTEKEREAASLGNQLSVVNRQLNEELRKYLGAHGYDVAYGQSHSYVDNIAGFVAKYKDRSDYDNIYNEIRAQIFRATALHEMGHCMGLRHNRTGSYDSMNYFNNFWNLRRDDKFEKDITTVGDMYALYDFSEEQLAGGMLNSEYSSIMDYMVTADDERGLGKYDHAAILYAYSSGTSLYSDKKSSNGLVEIFTKGNGDNGYAGKAELGDFAYNVLTHKDTTGTSTFDDQTAIGQNYLELVHYHDFFWELSKANFDFINNRALARIDAYLAAKDSATPMIRVPYLNCSDENDGALRSCHVFDHGADYYEQVRYFIDDYNKEYWFTDFARGRKFFSSYRVSGWYERNFFYLSDFLQSYYVSDRDILRDVLGEYYEGGWGIVNETSEAALGASFNLLAKVLATPQYGLYCKRFDTGELFALSDDDEATKDTSEFYRRSRCGDSADYYYIRQGDGRRKYRKYDASQGFDYSIYEAEAEHWQTQVSAIFALFDNEATVIVDGGDMGNYTLGMYDWFREETIALADALLSENNVVAGPILVTDDGNGGIQTTTYNGEEMKTGTLKYPPLVTHRYYTDDGYIDIDPTDGSDATYFTKLAASRSILQSCNKDEECAVIGDGVSACVNFGSDDAVSRCIPLFYDQSEINCPAELEGVRVGDDVYSCLPAELLDAASDAEFEALWASESDKYAASILCSPQAKIGYCDADHVCVDGECKPLSPRVELDTSLNVKFYTVLWGMLTTGPWGMDPLYYDQLNIYRVGSGSENAPGDEFKRATFENPFTGEVFAANYFDCDKDKDGNYSTWCYDREVSNPGGVQMIDMANERKARANKFFKRYLALNDAINWDDPNHEKTAAYTEMLNAYYTYRMAMYDVEYAIRDINLVMNAYSAFGSVW